VLDRLDDLAPAPGRPGPRPVVDLAGLNGPTTGEVLAWFEADAARHGRLLLVRSRGSIELPDHPAGTGMSGDNLSRFRALGGVIGLSVGLPEFSSTEGLQAGIEKAASVPFQRRPGYEGIGLGTDFLNLEQTLPGLETVAGVSGWLERSFSDAIARSLAQGNARDLLLRAAGRLEGQANWAGIVLP
jgi:membrane dipeptidase